MRRVEYFLSGALDSSVLADFYKMLRRAELNSDDEFHLFIQSEGGSVGVGLSIAKMVMGAGCKTVTYNVSNVDSAAVTIFAAGDIRIASPCSVFYVHAIGRELYGVKTAEELRAIITEIDADTARIAEYLSSRTRLSVNDWRDLMTSPCVLTAEKGYEIGLVSSVSEFSVYHSATWIGSAR